MLGDLSFDGREYRRTLENTACFVERDIAILKMAREKFTPSYAIISRGRPLGGFIFSGILP
jgi:hypothetical protein